MPSGLPPPPPLCSRQSGVSASDTARRHLASRRTFLHSILTSLHRKHTSSPGSHTGEDHAEATEISPEEPRSTTSSADDSGTVIRLDGFSAAQHELENGEDVYKWAVLYEIQRGATIFSTQYYSPASLLPFDPPPFTVPSASDNPAASRPTVSLNDYPLPDGTWRWVSRAWMIDMRSDGAVQYDGFEYNWVFRRKGWRPTVGFLSAGGFVRRRRWVRLMMRPGKRVQPLANVAGEPVEATKAQELEGAMRPPSAAATSVDDNGDAANILQGDEGDWPRCRAALRRLGRDGKKLELWILWLNPLLAEAGDSRQEKGKEPRKQWTEDEEPMPSEWIREEELAADVGMTISREVPREHLAAILRDHGSDILATFVYPDSRAQFLEMLEHAGLLHDLRTNLEVPESTPLVEVLDFWSYTHTEDIAPNLPSS
ncbi:hypothetical protein OBBRIDRAFT_787611 [Obba rivulosa]|uniref:TECPR1-like DysF domain-containing protein n=1 Tax=Obba rivulosa TaxID=1052685 RepID=A0A8E2J720_9APHY|nr:hypothetical protein OBBRIDRAFT_787611 [Obba rivulosa]